MSNARRIRVKNLRERCVRFREHRLELITEADGHRHLVCQECPGPVQIRRKPGR